jgi:MFS transporter, ACS family, tartrate transporter
VASGAPISTARLGLDVLWGLKGWQCLYVLEAIPTVLVGICVFFYLTDRPSEARWLKPEERDWLNGRMVHERRLIEAHHGIGVLRAFFDPKVVMLSLNYIGIVTASLGMLLFVPLIIKDLGVSNVQVGWLTMIPYIAGAISMVFCGWLSDHIGDRRRRRRAWPPRPSNSSRGSLRIPRPCHPVTAGVPATQVANTSTVSGTSATRSAR